MGRSILFVAAHPDDDAFGLTRTVALHAADPDFRFVVVLATDGEAGEIAPDSTVAPDELGAARRREDLAAWSAVGRHPDRLVWLGLPPWDPAEPFHIRGVPDDTVGIDVDTSEVVEATIKAIRAHHTQWSYAAIASDHMLRDSLGREHWVIVWPPRPEGFAVLGGVFESI
jgi:LmbE family N-acetylglucosaminyl deacetylase